MRKTGCAGRLAGRVGGMSILAGCALATVALGMGMTTPAVQAHEERAAAPKGFDASRVEDTPYGRAADPKTATRTVRVSMNDRMRFDPATITVRRGETLRFVVRNEGKVLHEMVLGTPEDIAQHAELMRKFPGMEHDEPNMVHVKPGASGEMAWTFDKPGTFAFACLVPGHFEAGMTGKVVVK
jgi:uncharacterized cupredoxin-like copper-binding protein